MGRKALDTSDETERITLRIPKRQTEQMDGIRGDQSRSGWIRDLITSALDRTVVKDVNVINVYVEESDEPIATSAAEEAADLLGSHAEPPPFPQVAPFEQSQADPQAPATMAAQEEVVETATKRSRPSRRTPDSGPHRHRRDTLIERRVVRGVPHESWRCDCGHVIET